MVERVDSARQRQGEWEYGPEPEPEECDTAASGLYPRQWRSHLAHNAAVNDRENAHGKSGRREECRIFFYARAEREEEVGAYHG